MPRDIPSSSSSSGSSRLHHRRVIEDSRAMSSVLPGHSSSAPTPESKPPDNRNVLEMMASGFEKTPLHIINACIKKNKLLKVWSRNDRGIRGILTGRPVAFDRYWNLVLTDVNEVYFKKNKKKAPYLFHLNKAKTAQIPEGDVKVIAEKLRKEAQKKKIKEEKTRAPDVAKKVMTEEEKLERKKFWAEKRKEIKLKKKAPIMGKRHVDCLFLRGDSIVMISIVPDG